MGIALLFMALFPLAFLPDFITSQADDADEDEDGEIVGDGTDLLDEGSEPGDPETPDILDILAPIDEDEAPSDTEDPDAINAPIIEDDEATGTDETGVDVSSPVDEIETGSDTFLLNFEEVTGVGHAEIESFDFTTDILRVFLRPESVEGQIDVSVTPSDGGSDMDVYVENILVAVLKNAAGATADNVIAEIGSVNV